MKIYRHTCYKYCTISRILQDDQELKFDEKISPQGNRVVHLSTYFDNFFQKKKGGGG